MKKIILSFAFIFSFLQILSAQNCQISGIVHDGESGLPLAGVVARIDNNSAWSSTSDEKGFFQIQNLPCNFSSQKMVLYLMGYTPLFIDMKYFINKQNIDFKLYIENKLLQAATVTAARFERTLGEQTVSLDILKPTLIENTNTRKLDDVLQKIPGVQILDGQANIRGGSGYSYGAGSRVLLLMDDMPMLQADAGSTNWRDLPIENIEQVDVVKGAASALYGSSAMNGIINVRTGFAKASPETKISTFGVLFDAPKDPTKKWWTNENRPYEAGGSVLHKIKLGKLDFVASAFYLNQMSYNKDFFEKVGRINISTRYRIHERLHIGINANFNTGGTGFYFYWNGAGSHEGTPATVSSNNRTRYTIDPSVIYFDKLGNRHKILTRYYSVDNELSGANQSNSSKLYYGEYQFQRNIEKLDLVTTAGLVLTQTYSQAALYGNNEYFSQNWAAYLQLDKKFFDKLSLSLGARWENNALRSPRIINITDFLRDTLASERTSEARPVFRFGANYELTKNTFFRASFGQGYRYATIAEKFIRTNAGFPIFPNPRLESETGWTAEIGAKQGFQFGGLQGFVDVAGFWQEYTNMMEFNLDFNLGGFRSLNVGNTRIRGGEISVLAQGKIGEVTPSVLMGYTYILPEYRDFEERKAFYQNYSTSMDNILKYRIKHNAKIDAEAAWRNFTLGFAVNYLSRMDAIDRAFELFIPQLKTWRDNEPKSVTITDLRCSYRPIPALKVSFLVNNVFNKAYTLRPALLEAPRHFSLRLDAQF
jgi:iron complex outermembrane receptor protein